MPHAVDDLEAIYDFIAEDSIANAKKTIAKIINREQQIISHPESGKIVKEFERDDIREITETPFRIIYQIKENTINIITVMHGARLLRKIPGIDLNNET